MAQSGVSRNVAHVSIFSNESWHLIGLVEEGELIAGQLHCAKRGPHERFSNRGCPPCLAQVQPSQQHSLARDSKCRPLWRDGIRRLFAEVGIVTMGFNAFIPFRGWLMILYLWSLFRSSA